MVDPARRDKIRSAFHAKTLRVLSVSPTGERAWKRVLDVSRAAVGPETIVGVSTATGSSVLTGGHRVFLTPSSKVEAESLTEGGSTIGGVIRRIRPLPPREFMYDLTAEDWHNFHLHRSGLLVSNSPDRNYHFRPPAHEDTVKQFNRVFGFIWQDEELGEYIDRALNEIIAKPPRTPFANVDTMVAYRREWTTLLLTGAMWWALHALQINWVADEFDYSIGGVSLNLEKSAKYESAAQATAEQFEKQLENAKATVNFIKGLQQPKYGTGIRSAFGPYAGRGVLSPRKFVGL